MLAFHLDEHMDHAIAHGLRSRGVSVTTTAEAGLLGASDSQHLEYALREQRVTVTNDSDFLLLASEGVAHAGIAYAPRGARSIGHFVRYLCLMNDCLEPSDMAGRVEFL